MLRVRPWFRIASSSWVRAGSSIQQFHQARIASHLMMKTNVPRSNSLNKPISSRLFSDQKALEPVSFNVQSQEEFDDLVLSSDTPVIVDFHADWCGPCKMLGPRLESMVSGRGGAVLLAKVNIDSCSDLAIDYGVQVVPTVIAFKNGESTEQFVGMQDDQMLDEFINRLIDE